LYEPKLALVFPAFANEYPPDAKEVLPGFEQRLKAKLSLTPKRIATCLEQFDFISNNFLEDEFKTQLITYSYSCTLSDMLKEGGVKADYLSGFSMGIYAALYHADSISYETGLTLISKAYLDSIQCLRSRQFTMGTTVGLSMDDVNGLIEQHNLPLEIINLNSTVTITVSGLFDDVSLLLEKAIGEGALKTRMLKVSVPYHTRYLAPVAETFSQHVRETEIHAPAIPVISQIDQSILHGPMAIGEELVKNLYHHLSFMHTHGKLLELGVRSFAECGPGRSLTRNSRFLEGEFRFYHPSEII
jgi:[acyl-carrier-protein] S-malonyltransferase